MHTTVIQKQNIHSQKNRFIINTAIAGSITAVALGADLFLAKGKIISGLTRVRISFIKNMADDIANVLAKDPATKSSLEAFLCTPGLHALWGHRVAHKLYKWNVPIIPRLISNISRIFTGIEIHPGAEIGQKVFIDHTGGIIGETAKVGNNVTLIGRFCLGATGKEHGLRHTIVEDGVTVCMDSAMLGRIKLGKNSTIGAGALVTHNVPAEATVIGNPAKIIRIGSKKIEPPVFLKDFKTGL